MPEYKRAIMQHLMDWAKDNGCRVTDGYTTNSLGEMYIFVLFVPPEGGEGQLCMVEGVTPETELDEKMVEAIRRRLKVGMFAYS